MIDHGRPAHVVDVCDRLTEAEHLHHVGVPFRATHEDGFAQCCVHVAERAFTFRSCPFAHIDLGVCARIAVVVMVGSHEPCGSAVVVFIDKVDGMRQSPLGVVRAPAGVVADADDVGIAFLDGIVELDVAFGMVVEGVVLVANLDIFQVEGFGMTCLGTLCAPCRSDVAVAVLNDVECFLNVFAEVLIVVCPSVA